MLQLSTNGCKHSNDRKINQLVTSKSAFNIDPNTMVGKSTSVTPENISSSLKNQNPVLTDRLTSILGKSSQFDSISNRDKSLLLDSKVHPTTFSPSTLVKIIRKILSSPCEKLHPSPFCFERSLEAASHNSKLLQQMDSDVTKVFSSLQRSFTHSGSEFRYFKFLKELFSNNTNWVDFKTVVQKGIDYQLTPITEEERLQDIEFHLDRGNHKSANDPDGLAALNKAYDKEVSYGWQIPLLPSYISSIKDAGITPLGVAKQWSFNEKNERYIKRRVTHDCSFPGPSGNSPNIRTPDDLLEDCLYGFALKRLLHQAHQMRFRFKKTKILCFKTDMDAAYRRLHAALVSALSFITVIEKIAYLLLRLPFGAKIAAD